LWDEWLYAGSAEHYAVGRLPYPEGIATVLCSRLDLPGDGRLLDLGCGPGSLTLLLAPLFASAVGVDADADMLQVGRALAEQRGVGNVTWVHSRAEDLPDDLGPFEVATLAQSFHWMDQPVVVAKLRRLLVRGGCCVHVGATTHEGVADAVGLPHPAPPRAGIADLVRDQLGPERRAGKKVVTQQLSSDQQERAVFRAAGFDGPERIEVAAGNVVVRTEDEVVASVLSLSSSAPHLFGSRLPAFVADLRGLLREASPEGLFAEQQRDVTLSVWRA
jgi:ubiquinone/menaquinone biosynthesis C-methylase UbiE